MFPTLFFVVQTLTSIDTCGQVRDVYRVNKCCDASDGTPITPPLSATIASVTHLTPYNKTVLNGQVFQDPYNGFYIRFENDYMVEYTNKNTPWERWYIQPENGEVRNPPEMIANFTIPQLLASGEAVLNPNFDITPLFTVFTQASALGYPYFSTWSVRMSFNADYTEMRHDYFDACMQRADGLRYNTGVQFTAVLQKVNDVAGLPYFE